MLTPPTTGPGPAPRAQQVVLLDAVLERDRELQAAPNVLQPGERPGGVEALGQQDRDLGRLDPLGPPVRPQRHEQLLAAALEAEPARRLDRARVRLAGEQLDVVPRPREQAAVDAAERPGPDDQHALGVRPAHRP